jgi:hypothetical protein
MNARKPLNDYVGNWNGIWRTARDVVYAHWTVPQMPSKYMFWIGRKNDSFWNTMMIDAYFAHSASTAAGRVVFIYPIRIGN